MFGKIGDIRDIYKKYKDLNESIKNVLVRGKEGKYVDEDGEEQDAVIIEMSGEMMIKDIVVNDPALFDIKNKEKLENMLLQCFEKVQNKVRETVSEKTESVMGFDPSNIGEIGKLL